MMMEKYRRTPKNYSGAMSPIKNFKEILPDVLQRIENSYSKSLSGIIKVWNEIIGKELAHFTEPVELKDKILIIKVKSSTLHSLLAQYEKKRILKELNRKFPKNIIKDLSFLIG